MKCISLIILLAILFVITYDPKSGMLEKYLASPGSILSFPPTAQQAVSDSRKEDQHFERVQFG